MQIQELYDTLVRAYTPENLNELTSGIISLYRRKDISALRRIHSLMYNGNQGGEERISRIFTRIITHYHPDRQEQINKELQVYLYNNDIKGMQQFDHILDVQKLDLNDGGSGYEPFNDFDFGDIWDYSAGGYSYINDEGREEDDFDAYTEMIMDHGFIAAVKRNVYGHLNVEFPVHLLADMEIIEMAEYEIENLDGIEYCTYARIIDLSGNNLTNVTILSQLLRLEEVFLQNNQITYIDGLSELPFLRILDLSHNDVDDISSLFEVDTLEFLNIIGNRVPEWQLEKLSLDGVIIVH
ncbi:MAG: leucine-rich repeat domain-containing protein [Bacteroidales bacterium]